MSVETLISQIQDYNPDAEMGLLERCYHFAQKAHEGQFRKSGEPYFTHCVKTAEELAALRLDTHTICAGLLHDVLEDTGVTREEMDVRFGWNITNMVEGVTKIGKYKFRGGQRQRQAETYRKLLLATAEDMRVILIKLADRMHNMETLQFLTDEKCQRIAKETLEIYAPIAHRLGIWRIMSRLEDLAFKHLFPTEYREIAELLDEKLVERQAYCQKMVARIREELEGQDIFADVRGRTKHIYSIYQKMQQKGTPFKDICDLVGLRILVKTDKDCYLALGALHHRWHYLPDRLRDWIGQPRKNGYMSLHTTIVDNGKPVEIQIRSYEMHKIAEDGIAAHWSYKEGAPNCKQGHSIFANYKQMLEDIQDTQEGAHQFVASMKLQLVEDEVYVFSPKGDLFALPTGSTAIDFAYKIHTDIGNTCCSAEINGAAAPLRQELQNGDRVHIRTHPNCKPSRGWLRYVKTSNACNKIKHWFREKERADAIKLGKKFLRAELRLTTLNASDYLNPTKLLDIAKQLQLQNVEELLVRIGRGYESATHVVNLLKPDTPEPQAVPPKTAPMPGIELENGIDLGMIRIMKCCNPIPGDEVIGYVTRGRGVSVHRSGCARILDVPERILTVKWPEKQNRNRPGIHPAQICVQCNDRPGMLGEITTVIAQCNVNIRSGTFQPAEVTRANNDAQDILTLDVTGTTQLTEVMQALRHLKDVQRVTRKF